MKFHMHLLPTYHADRDPSFDVYFQNILEQVALAEELGWECFWFTEHHFLLYGGPVPNPAVMMSAAAARTSKIHLGSAISILGLHHPIQTAEDYAMVDVMSGGRLEFGIGVGNTALDYEVYGVDRDQSRERYQEAAEIIRKAWSQERFSHEGKFWKFDDVSLLPRPVQTPHPRIWVASTSADGLGWAGSQGFDAMTVAHPVPPERVRPGTDAWREQLAANGHNPADHHIKLHLRVWVDENAQRAKEVAEAAILRYDEVSTQGRSARVPETYNWEEMLATGRNCYGNPDQVIKAIQAAQANYDFDIFSTTFHYGGLPAADIQKSMRLFAKEVMPAFK